MLDWNADIAKRLVTIRESKGFSQTVVAKALGVARNTLITWETGRIDFSVSMLEDICRFYNIPLKDFLFPGAEFKPIQLQPTLEQALELVNAAVKGVLKAPKVERLVPKIDQDVAAAIPDDPELKELLVAADADDWTRIKRDLAIVAEVKGNAPARKNPSSGEQTG